jgi:hypothetical protein
MFHRKERCPGAGGDARFDIDMLNMVVYRLFSMI